MNDNVEGIWRTVGGRRIFIKEGQSLDDAMKESGKFKNLAKEQAQKRFNELKEKYSDGEVVKDNGIEKINLNRIPYDDTYGRYNDTTQDELNQLPVKISFYGVTRSCIIYKNKGEMFRDIDKTYGGLNQMTDHGKTYYSISSESGIGEYYLVRDQFAKGGWVWKDCNDDTVKGYEHSKRFKD